MAEDRQEKPTKRRQDKARKEAQFPASRELLDALQLLLFVYLLTTFGGSLVERLRRVFRAELAMAFHRTPQVSDVTAIASGMIAFVGIRLLACGSCLMVGVLSVQMAATQFGFAGEKLAPDFSRLNPTQKLKSMLGQNMAAFFQAVFLIVLFSSVVIGLVKANEEIFVRLPSDGNRKFVGRRSRCAWQPAVEMCVDCRCHRSAAIRSREATPYERTADE